MLILQYLPGKQCKLDSTPTCTSLKVVHSLCKKNFQNHTDRIVSNSSVRVQCKNIFSMSTTAHLSSLSSLPKHPLNFFSGCIGSQSSRRVSVYSLHYSLR